MSQNNVQCPACSAVSDEREWNEETQAEYGEDFIPIIDGVMYKGCIYICPVNGCQTGVPFKD